MNTTANEELSLLIERSVAGDRAALEAVLESVQDLVFNLSLGMLGTFHDAEDASQDILFRLSRVRRRMADFLSEYCGEYGEGSCRCPERVNYAIANRRISPQRLEFTAAKPSAAALKVVEAMEEIDGLSQQFAFCRTYQSPERLKQMVRDFLDGAAFSAVAKA